MTAHVTPDAPRLSGLRWLFYDFFPFVGPHPQAVKFFAALRERGGGVGYDDQGRLVWGLPGGGIDVVRDADGKPVGTAH